MNDEMQALANMRKQGKAPANVTIWLDDYEPRKAGERWYELSAGREELAPEIHIKPTDNIELMDFRPLVGLDVQIWAKKYTLRMVDLMHLLQNIPCNTIGAFFGTEDDIDGMLWTRSERVLGELSDHQALVAYCEHQRSSRGR